MNIELKNNVAQDEYTDYVCAKYDLDGKTESITVVPMFNKDELDSFEWNIGLVVGESGSGKSTILRQFGDFEEFRYNEEKPVVSQFEEMTPEEVEDLLHGVGLNSIPTWLQSPHTLSVGQKARLDAAKALSIAMKGNVVTIDEWTSTVDRETAKSLSFSIQRFIRAHNLKVIFASCHYDILYDKKDKCSYLQPDWVYSLNKRDENGNCDLCLIDYEDKSYDDASKRVSDGDVLTRRHMV